MFNCRYKNSHNAPKPLHVHDDPGSLTDAIRCADNGWEVQLDKCVHPELPFTMGDSKFVVHTIIDAVERGDTIHPFSEHGIRRGFVGA